jgi:hypothetical protein
MTISILYVMWVLHKSLNNSEAGGGNVFYAVGLHAIIRSGGAPLKLRGLGTKTY